MTMAKFLIGGAGLAALASAAPSAAQYYPYGNAYGYGYGIEQPGGCEPAARRRCRTGSPIAPPT